MGRSGTPIELDPPRGTRHNLPGLTPASGHVVQVVQSIDRGGLEMMSVDLAIAIRRRGFDSTVVALTAGGRLEARLAEADVRFELVGNARYWSPQSQYATMRILRRLRPTAVHTHHLPSLLNAGAVARGLGVPRVVHTEHAYRYLERGAWVRQQFRWAARMADAVAVVGDAIKPYYVQTVGVPEHRMRVVPNGIDLDRFRPLSAADVQTRRRAIGLPTTGTVVGAVGRLAPEKDYALLLRAAAKARELGASVSVVLVGDGEERAELERLSGELGGAATTTFLGWRSDVAQLVGAFDVLAVTSTTEALPLVVLEAMSSGVPVVSTAVGEIPRVLDKGRLGLLVAPGDVGALAEALVRLADRPELRRALGDASRERVSREYSHARMVDRYIALYDPSSVQQSTISA